jgi:hypothetical protein
MASAGSGGASAMNANDGTPGVGANIVAYHGVTERSTAIRRTLEAGRSRKESAQPNPESIPAILTQTVHPIPVPRGLGVRMARRMER